MMREDARSGGLVAPSERDELRASRIAVVSWILVAQTPLYAALLARVGFWDLAVAVLVLGTGFLLPLIALRVGAPLGIAGSLVCVNGAALALFVAWNQAGPIGASAIPSVLVPLAATLLVSPRAGWAWVGIIGGALLVLAQMDQREWTAVASSVEPNARATSHAVVLLVVAAVVQGSISAVVRLEERHRRMLAAALAELELRVADRTRELEREVVVRRLAEEEAQRATRAKSTFLANMSHELRTPLNAILGYTEMVLDELEDRADLRSELARVTSAGRHLLRLIEDILDLARVEREELELRLGPVDLVATAEECVALVRPEFEARGNTLSLERPTAAPPLWGDRDRVRQVVVNLLSNANKFTDRGVVRLVARVEVDAAVFEVVDTGVGIPEALLGQVFDRFVQADDSPTRRAGGAGLGLAIARELAHRMGGTLEVASTVGVGSTFRLRLPLDRQPARGSPPLRPIE